MVHFGIILALHLIFSIFFDSNFFFLFQFFLDLTTSHSYAASPAHIDTYYSYLKW